MACFNCGSENVEVFFVENIPCSHCDGKTELVYAGCNDCHIMWKSVDDKIINTSLDAGLKIDGVLSDDDLECIDNLFLPLNEEIIPDVTTMSSMIHKCIRCKAVSYEVKPNYYHCPECGFDWEVLA